MMKQGIKDTLKVGISPGLNFIFGNKGDNKETLKKAVDFLLNMMTLLRKEQSACNALPWFSPGV